MATMEITMQIGCSLMCTFCPQNSLTKSYKDELKSMTFENYVQYLAKIPKHVRIDFSGMSEPWLNKDATRILEYTLENGYKVSVYSTLYGMSKEDALNILNLIKKYNNQVEGLTLHLPDATGNMRGFKVSDEYLAVLEQFLQFKKENIMSNMNIMTMDHSGNYHKDISSYLEKSEKWFAISRAGNVDQVNKIQHKSPIYCAWTPYYDQNVLLPNGDVVLCCMDYSLNHILGNLNESEDYYQLFRSDSLNDLRIENQKMGFSSNTICKSCERGTCYTRPKSLKRQIKDKLLKVFNFK